MTAFSATPERIITAIDHFPDHIQKQFLIDRMDMYLGYGAIPQKGDVPFKLMHMDNPKEAEELLNFRKEGLKRCKSISMIFCMINKPDRLQLLQFLSGVYVFDKKEYAQLLRDAWIATEFPHQMPNKNLMRLFQNADAQFLMTEEEIKALGTMPDEFPVFRGLQDDRARRKALSWTTSYEVAHWFASRWKAGVSRPRIYKAVVCKKNVYMYTNSRNEEEVVVNPNRLKKIEEVGVL